MRAVEEWVGKTDDDKIPARVKLRIWARCGGRCSLTRRKILAGEPFDFEHRIALCNGGRHAEFNIVLVLRGKAHREKTAEDLAQRVKVDRVRAKHLGIWARPKRRLQSRGFQKTPQIAGASSRDEP